MLSNVMNALARKRRDLSSDDKGFTLIELLVVVIIIGILAAIAIPIYIGVQNNAKDSAVKSDLTNIKTALVAAYTTDQGATMPTGTLTDTSTVTLSDGSTTKKLTDLGATFSADYAATDASGPAIKAGPGGETTWTDFCVEATGETGNPFHITSSGGVDNGACS